MANIALITNNILSDSGTALTSVLSGSGTTNYLSKFTGSTALGNSIIYDNGTAVGIGTTSPSEKLEVDGGSSSVYIKVKRDVGYALLGAGLNFNAIYSRDNSNNPKTLYIESANVLIGTTTDAGYKLQVAGTGYVSSTLQVGGGAYNGYTLQVEGPATFGDTVIQNLPANGNALGGITSYQSQSNLTYNFSNGNYSGETITGFVLTDVYAGQIVALRPSAQLWQKADASVNGPLGYNMLGIVCYDATSGNSTTILLNGFFASNSYYSSSPQFGSPMYLSPTIQGNAEDTAPSTTGNIVRIVGHINEYSNANGVFVLRFNPDNFWLVI